MNKEYIMSNIKSKIDELKDENRVLNQQSKLMIKKLSFVLVQGKRMEKTEKDLIHLGNTIRGNKCDIERLESVLTEIDGITTVKAMVNILKLNGFNNTEIADMMGISRPTVYNINK